MNNNYIHIKINKKDSVEFKIIIYTIIIQLITKL